MSWSFVFARGSSSRRTEVVPFFALNTARDLLSKYWHDILKFDRFSLLALGLRVLLSEHPSEPLDLF